jgi:hypothetical protein
MLRILAALLVLALLGAGRTTAEFTSEIPLEDLGSARCADVPPRSLIQSFVELIGLFLERVARSSRKECICLGEYREAAELGGLRGGAAGGGRLSARGAHVDHTQQHMGRGPAATAVWEGQGHAVQALHFRQGGAGGWPSSQQLTRVVTLQSGSRALSSSTAPPHTCCRSPGTWTWPPTAPGGTPQMAAGRGSCACRRRGRTPSRSCSGARRRQRWSAAPAI